MQRYFDRTPLIYLFFFTSFLAISCGADDKVDISKIKLEIKIDRFDQALNKLNSANFSSEIPRLKEDYGDFYEDYVSQMLGIGTSSDTAYYAILRDVLSNIDYMALNSEITQVFPNLSTKEQELTDAFKHILYFYPEQKVPRLISFVSGFTVQTPIGNNYIGIGLDMFLGADSKFYPSLRGSIPAYISRRFTPENITPRVIEYYIREEVLPERDDDRSMLSKMIYNGKILYFMNTVMPEIPDSLLIGYSDQQLKWAEENEANIWAYFLEENLLFEADYRKIQKYLSEAPFTPGIGDQNESAPKLGIWAGWQIVRKYAADNPEISLQELMKNTDAQEILSKSGYKPK